MVARHEEEYSIEKKVFICFLVWKGLMIGDVGVSRDTVLQEVRPGAGFETGDFVKEKLGGAAVKRHNNPVYVKPRVTTVSGPYGREKNLTGVDCLPNWRSHAVCTANKRKKKVVRSLKYHVPWLSSRRRSSLKKSYIHGKCEKKGKKGAHSPKKRTSSFEKLCHYFSNHGRGNQNGVAYHCKLHPVLCCPKYA